MDTGPFFSGTFGHPGGPTLKGLAIKLGDQAQASVCYDTELLRMSCGWTGGFLKFNPSRFGLISAPVIEGQAHFHTGPRPGVSPSENFADPRPKPLYGPLPRDFAHYEGMSLHGSRVVLRYTIGTAQILETPWAEGTDPALIFTREFEVGRCRHPVRIVLSDAGAHAELVGAGAGDGAGAMSGAEIQGTPGKNLTLLIPARDATIRIKAAIWTADPASQAAHRELVKKSPPCVKVAELTQPGPGRWGEPLVTQGVVSNQADPYVLDTLTVPFENRYRALMFLSGHDFFENGDAAVCTAHGDVWRVGGIDDKLERITWKRFATGLFQPLGLKIVKDAAGKQLVYVLGRDQITRLHDQNADGEADFYENFNNEGQVTTNSHEFATCLETDSHGNFYYLKGDSGSQTLHDGCLLRVTPDGQKLEVFATGFRNANGMSIGPDDTITVAPQEGTWTPGSAVFQVRQGGFYGAMQSHHRAVPPTTYDRPICWLPRLQDNSSGGQAWVTSDRWGPLQGQLLHFSFGTCRMFLTLRENLDEGVQGGTVQFPLLFDSGVMRGRFRAQDGQLYVTGLKGWVSSAVQDGCFQRVRYTGTPVDLPIAMQTYSNGVALTFSEPLDREAAEDPDNYGAEEWNYLWSGNYGSPELKVTSPNQVGRDEIDVKSATLLPDGRTVFLELALLNPAMQVGINYTLNSRAGRPIKQTFYATLHKLGASPQPAQLTRKERAGQLPARQEEDLKPGLVLTITSEGPANRTEQAVSRMAAIYIPRQQVESVAGPGVQLGARWSGYLKVPAKGNYAFRIETQGQAQLKLGDLQVTPDEPVALRRGYQPLQLSFAGQGEIAVRLMWKAPDLPWEAVPPGQLFFLSSDNLAFHREARAGRDSFLQRSCGNCHTLSPASGVAVDHAVWRTPARQLTDLGNRYTPEWIAAWIQTPSLMVKGSAMPRLFHASTPAESQAIADIAKMLAESARQTTNAELAPATDADFDAGLQLYESLGCVGCHRLNDDYDSPLKPRRRSLHFVAKKFRAGEIAKFLQNPRQHSPAIRMPDFRLTPDEARSLEAYLRGMSKGELEPFPELATADAKRGLKEFDAVGCRHCHTLNSTDQLLPADKKPLTAGPHSLVCEYGGSGRQGVPAFDLTLRENMELKSFLNFSMKPASQEFDIERTRRQMEYFNCSGCHSRDAQNSPLAELLVDEGEGRPPEMLPHLTWSGEKLRADWMDRLLHGKLAYVTRPWLKARMPSFPANRVAFGLAAEHGIRFDAPPVVDTPSVPEVELGRKLTLKDQGLDCRQCHGLGAEKPSGDHSTLISVGINFSHIPDRLNPEFFPRLMLNPPRYDPNSRMPVFAVDGRTTAAKGILDGNADRQFHALWEYLKSRKP